MYLVHARFACSADAELPYHVRELIWPAVRHDERIEHVAVHPSPPSGLTLGFYVRADRIEEAEARTRLVCLRLLREVPQLRGARLVGTEAPLVPLAFEPTSLNLLP